MFSLFADFGKLAISVQNQFHGLGEIFSSLSQIATLSICAWQFFDESDISARDFLKYGRKFHFSIPFVIHTIKSSIHFK